MRLLTYLSRFRASAYDMKFFVFVVVAQFFRVHYTHISISLEKNDAEVEGSHDYAEDYTENGKMGDIP